ncbi:hypothetical protein QCA50_015001 [Cerrena zonata]|uniref:CFEM domain-containing protein n=1 Tax=Cerrena zonata TaxID=2478898 RepID=A0AAW0FRX4_9APHY
MLFTYIITLALATAQATASIPRDNSLCQSQCSTLTDTTSSCSSDIACLCSESTNQGLATCLNCIISIAGAPDPSEVGGIQESVAQFEDACKSAGHPLSSLTISGATAAGSATGAASSNPTATSVGTTGISATGASVAVTGVSTSGSAPAQASTTTGADNANPASMLAITTPLSMVGVLGGIMVMLML